MHVKCQTISVLSSDFAHFHLEKSNFILLLIANSSDTFCTRGINVPKKKYNVRETISLLGIFTRRRLQIKIVTAHKDNTEKLSFDRQIFFVKKKVEYVRPKRKRQARTM